MSESRERGTGTVLEYTDGKGRKRYRVGVRLADGTRKWKTLKPDASAMMADDKARNWTEQEGQTNKNLNTKRRAAGVSTPGESLSAWFDRFCASRVGKVHWIIDDQSRFKNHIASYVCQDGAKLGDKPIVDVTARDLEGLVSRLDQKIFAEELAWTTAATVWSLVTTMFGEACKSKLLSLRVPAANSPTTDPTNDTFKVISNPTHDVNPPERGAERSKTFLYPNEFLQLVSCGDVPLHRRRLYACAVYLYGRCAEIEALDWTKVNLDVGTFQIDQAMDRLSDDDELKTTKAGDDRELPIEKNLIPLLQALHGESDGEGRVIARHPHRSDLAKDLREDLKLAGVTRARLFVNDRERINLRYHDLRGTAATWMAMRGDDTTDIMECLGHGHFQTTMIYIRKGKKLAKAQGLGQPFPPLPVCLLGKVGSQIGSRMRNRATLPRSRTGVRPTERVPADTNMQETPDNFDAESQEAGSTPKAKCAEVTLGDAVIQQSDPKLAALWTLLDAATKERDADAVSWLTARIQKYEADHAPSNVVPLRKRGE